MNLTKTKSGKINLHIWNKGGIYEMVLNLKKANEWNNIRFSVYPYPDIDLYITRDLRDGIPYPDESFHAIVVTRMIEHLTLEENRKFLLEIFRILKPGGVVRLSTPNLKEKVKNYIKRFDKYTEDSNEGNFQSYFWSVLDLHDQSNRVRMGGMLLEKARSGEISEKDMRESSGDVFDYILGKRNTDKNSPGKNIAYFFYGLRRRIMHFIHGRHPQSTREANMWMYDALSLHDELDEAGFKEIIEKEYNSSDIPEYSDFEFDTSPHGEYAIEPSLYMEGKK